MSQVAFDKKQEGYVGAFARRVQRRLSSAGGRVSYQDIFQELCIAWCKARDNWNEEFKVPFQAYLMRGMHDHINRWAKSELGFAHLTPISLDAGSKGADDGQLHEVFSSDEATPEDNCASQDVRGFVLARLSPRTRLFVQLLDNPPVFLLDAVKAQQAKQEDARRRGIKIIISSRVTAAMVLDFMEASAAERTAINKELAKIADSVHNHQPR